MERRIRLGVLFTFYYLFIISVANADTSSPIWTVSERLGAVEIRDTTSGQILSDEPGAQLRAPFIVTTGSDGYIVLQHGEDKASVSADSSLTVSQPESYAQGIITRVKQAFGSVLYQVEHRDTDGFAVDTPYLVSVVKGTTFNILVSADASTVSLIEGLLLVYTPDGHSHVMLKPGQTAIKSPQQDSITVKDQRIASAPVKGPITIVREGGTSVGLESSALDLTAEGLQTSNRGAALSTADVGLSLDTTPTVDIGETSLDVGSVSIDDTALTPAIDISDTSISTSGVDAGTTLGLNVDDIVTVDTGLPGITVEVDLPEVSTDITTDISTTVTDTTSTVADTVTSLLPGL